ncbi:hypothetical protein [Nostoc sp.]|uniref:hypothetical protein n=1 Tax=Nostoc sp. TaxID=1180 RepID=UPI002FF6C302
MTNIPISPIEAVNAAIQSHNPFTNAGIVQEQDVWGKKFPDVPTLNAHASNAVFQAIELVRTSQSSQDKVTSIAIRDFQAINYSIKIIRRYSDNNDNHQLVLESAALLDL